MELKSIQHLFKNSDQVAWVGSGGKSTLLFEIVNHFFSNAVITTSTHLGIEERTLIPKYIDISLSPLEPILYQTQSFDTNLLIYNGEVSPKNNKLGSPTEAELRLISNWCLINQSPLFIEADGSRKTPVKAPADHEPAIPGWINKVCVVVGLGSLGKNINETNVFRHHIFNEITESEQNDELTVKHLYQYLTHDNGGLKNIPSSAERILFIHQADRAALNENIFDFCYRLRSSFDHVILSSYVNGNIIIHAHFGRIAGIILAAGQAKRFGSPKQLAIWKQKTFIEHVIRNAINSDLDPIKVILGAYAEQISPYIKEKSIEVLFNPNWENGQATSVFLGVQSLPDNIDGVIFLLVDQPQITSQETKKIIQYFAKTKAKIIAFEYEHAFRHPILFSSVIFSEFSELSGDSGGRQLFTKYPPLTIKFDDAFYAMDIDTESDLNKLDK